METSLIFIFAPAALLIGGCTAGLWWAARTGRLENFEQGARAVFTEDEPEGRVLDRFPETENPTKNPN